MITTKEYKKHKLGYWVGKKVRVIERVSNGAARVFDVGAVLTITYNYGGFWLESSCTCEHCHIGRRYRISGVRPSELELIDLPMSLMCQLKQFITMPAAGALILSVA